MFNTPSVFSRSAEQDVWRHASRTIKLFYFIGFMGCLVRASLGSDRLVPQRDGCVPRALGIAKPRRIPVPCGLRFTAISGRPLLVGVDQRGTGQNMAHKHEDPCEFFLVIDALGVTWKVSLEEGLRTVAPNAQFD